MPDDPWSDPPKVRREFFGGTDAPSKRATGPRAGDGPTRVGHVPTSPRLVADGVVSPPLRDLMAAEPRRRLGIVIELSTGYPGGVSAAGRAVVEMLAAYPRSPATPIEGYVAAELTRSEIQRLVGNDRSAAPGAPPADHKPAEGEEKTVPPVRGAIYRIWPNFGTTALTIRSIITTKSQAAHRSFDATGRDIVWAVLDSGIQGDHAHFAQYGNLDGMPHKSFVDGDDAQALVDQAGHGTHVAGILAGAQAGTANNLLTAATWFQDDSGQDIRSTRTQFPSISGMAPECKLVSCQVLRPDGTGDVTALLGALQYVGQLNSGGAQVVHGVNISVGYPFDPSWFATGLTPVCQEVNRLVRAGVVVVVAAGNSGFGYALDPNRRQFRLGLDMTINDPGNADLVITVGSTSCSPHSTGVSYFSSKGPTGDGRMKPDLVAPGERIISAAAGSLLAQAQQVSPDATYVENSGTSMAAPHVSGAAAAFLSVQREFLGKPDLVRDVLTAGATDLHRSRHFQGAGLVDVMRSIQSV